MSRFRSAYNLRQLVDVVAEVIAYRGGGNGLTQHCFDEARGPAGHPRCPSARQIAARLGRSWDEALDLALSENPDRALGRQAGAEREELPRAEIADALRLVAARLGQQSLLPHDYRAERGRLSEEQGRAWRHGHADELPSVGQIEHAVSWDRALALAGLKPRRRRPRREGLPVSTVLDRVLGAYGALPTQPELELAAKTLGLSVRREAWIPALRKLREQRHEAGKWTPPRPPPIKDRPDYRHLPDGANRRRRSPRRHDQESLDRAMRAFLAELAPGERPTLRRYQAYCRTHPGTPWPASFASAGGWGTVRRRVLAQAGGR